MTAKDELPEGLRDKVEGPVFNLTHERMLCAHHHAIFEESWPEGYGVFIVKAFQAAAPSASVGMPENLPDNQQVGYMELQLSEKPACCRIEKEALLKVYRECRTRWPQRICSHCKKIRAGAKVPYGAPGAKKHVCLECFVLKLEMRTA